MHNVSGVIATPIALKTFAAGRSLPTPVALTVELSFLPLREEDFVAIVPEPWSDGPDRFVFLSEQLVQILKAASRDQAILYFETDYCGGKGAQGAIIFRDNATIYGPTWNDVGPINEALRMMGVRAAATARDEFETVGLQRYRSSGKWVELGARQGG